MINFVRLSGTEWDKINKILIKSALDQKNLVPYLENGMID